MGYIFEVLELPHFDSAAWSVLAWIVFSVASCLQIFLLRCTNPSPADPKTCGCQQIGKQCSPGVGQ